MLPTMKRRFSAALALLAATPVLCQGLRQAVRPQVGLLLLAHGGDRSWNDDIQKIRKELQGRYAVEVAFGMAENKPIQKSVDRLQAKGVKRILGVPLFVSSHSEVMDQTRFLFGLSDKPSDDLMKAPHGHMDKASLKKIALKVPFDLAQALDDHPLVSEILVARAKAVSRSPARESVLLVGHGPVSDEHNRKWLEAMSVHARRVQEALGFQTVEAATLRDDAPRPVREKAVKAMRDAVVRLSRQGRVIVLPLLLARGGIERKIPKELDGTFFIWKGETLAPHPNLAKWVEESVKTKTGPPGSASKEPAAEVPEEATGQTEETGEESGD